jgi:SEC-C motif-containing protein
MVKRPPPQPASSAASAHAAAAPAPNLSAHTPCPCGGQPPGATYLRCCARLIDAREPAHDAAELMRSRYTAYALHDYPYLRRTWHPDTCPADLETAAQDAQQTRWLGLNVKRSTQQDASHAQVEFVARYKIGGRAYRLHEISRFERSGEQWRYVDGEVLS